MSHADATMDAPTTRAVPNPVAPAPTTPGHQLPPETVRLLGVLMVGAFVVILNETAMNVALATIMAEIPKGASRLLTALEANEAVEALIERYMHKARRVTEDATAAEGAT